MRIVAAPDSFKGSLSSAQVAEAIKRGVVRAVPDAQVTTVLVADGGEGTVDALLAAKGGRRVRAMVQDPLGRDVEAEYGILPDGTAVIEMAAASGLPLLGAGELAPLTASTYGTGQLLKHALDEGCRTVLLGLGGSATNDGGTGAAAALGARFLDAGGKPLAPGGAALAGLASIDLSAFDKRMADVHLTLASDVTNPLCGENGAAAVYGPQKGASPEDVATLDAALGHLAGVVKTQTGTDWAALPGAGAAGGLGFGMMAFCGGALKPGIETVLDAAGMDALLADCDLLITGEGRLDGQSLQGKVLTGLAGRAQRYGVPVLAIAGSIGDGAQDAYKHGVSAVMAVPAGAAPLEDLMKNAAALVEAAAERAMRHILLGMGMAEQK